MRARWWLGFAIAVTILTADASAVGQTIRASTTIPLPAAGNVSVARLVIVAQRAKATRPPRLTVKGAGKLPPTTLVLAAVAPAVGAQGRFSAILAILRPPSPPPAPGSPEPPAAAKEISVRVPAGYSLTGQGLVANVLYQNDLPRFPLGVAGLAFVAAGTPPPRISPSRMLADARKLALDQNAPLADMELLGFEYVSAAVVRSGGPRSYTVTIGVSRLSQVNGVELTFPAGVNVLRASGPPRMTITPTGNKLQLIAPDRFQEAVPYTFTFELSRPLPTGSFFTLRASTHYFENILPFTERFDLSG